MDIIKIQGELKEEVNKKFLNELDDLIKARDKIHDKLVEINKKFEKHLQEYFPVLKDKPWAFNRGEMRVMVFKDTQEQMGFDLGNQIVSQMMQRRRDFDED